MTIIGAHVSAAGGIENAPARAAGIGCNAVQIFTSSPRTWQPASPDNINDQGFLAACKQYGIVASVIHTIYLVNLASDKSELVDKSKRILLADLKIASKLHSVGVVVHLGSHQGRGYQAMRQQLVEQLTEILEQTPDNSMLLIENSAGQKGKIASDLEEIKDLIDSVGSQRLGWCLDTCHAHAGGYALATSHRLQATSQTVSLGSGSGLEPEPSTQPVAGSLFDDEPMPKNIFSEIDRLNLWQSLKCVHVNDSRDPFDSGRDRHANLGQGMIAPDDLISFVNHPQIKSLPLILEVPGADGKGPDKENVETLKGWM